MLDFIGETEVRGCGRGMGVRSGKAVGYGSADWDSLLWHG
jgi:hypothetical protein